MEKVVNMKKMIKIELKIVIVIDTGFITRIVHIFIYKLNV